MKKTIRKIYAFFAIGIQNGDYNKEWDMKFAELLKKHEFTNVGKHTAMLGDVCIWISNIPYACMIPYGYPGLYDLSIRPSRYNILIAIRKLRKVQRQLVHNKVSEFIKSIPA